MQGQSYKYDYNWLMADNTKNIMVLSFYKPVEADNIRSDTVKKFVYFITGAMISDQNGSLKAYTNGCVINNSEYEIMDNGKGINPGNLHNYSCDDSYPGGELSAVFIPDFKDSLHYFLIHSSQVLDNITTKSWVDALRMSELDFKSNSLGKVLKKNLPFINDSSTLAIIAMVKHSNNRDWWIISKKYIKASWDKFLLDSTGVHFIDNQEIGDTTSYFLNSGSGNVLFSPFDGSKMIYYHPYEDGFFLFDFDRSTGELSHFQQIPVVDSAVLDGGACFSPSGKLLYISTYWDLYQYNLEAPDIKSSEIHIAHYDGYKTRGRFPAMIGRMQWGPDCKIYLNCRSSMDALHVINKPDIRGLDCDFRPHSLPLPHTHLGSIPYFPNYRLGVAPLCDPSLSVSVELVPTLPDLLVYPNPADNEIKFSLNKIPEYHSRIVLYNLTGELICSIELNPYTNEYKMNVENWIPGIYAWKLISKSSLISSGKIVIE